MSVIVNEKDLPVKISVDEAVEAAYCTELAETQANLLRGLPVLIECDKELAPNIYVSIRNRLRKDNIRCLYIDGRPNPNDPPEPIPQGIIGTMLTQLRNAIRGATEKRVLVLPHLDLLATTMAGLTNETRELIPLLYENPEILLLGFKDPTFPLPCSIMNVFPHQINILGISRNRLKHVITQSESRKFGKEFNPFSIYKHVSGMNVVRLRRLLSVLDGEDYPDDNRHAIAQVRAATLGSTLEIPNVDMEKDIGGYAKVKEQLNTELLDVLTYRESLTDESEIKYIEDLLPRGMLFHGPAGTGKATSLTSKLLTPTGWKIMGDIKVGDKVIGKNGKATKVTGVYPQGKKRLFQVKFSDGAMVECCKEHLWLTENSNARRDRMRGRNNSGFKVRTTNEIKNTLVGRDERINHYIPIVEPIQFKGSKLPFDPYLVGALLGNGGFTTGTPSFSSTYKELINNIKHRIPKDLNLRDGKRNKDYYITGNGKQNILTNWLRKANLYGKLTIEKHIPREYLYAKIEDRIELLRGLLDTDGYVGMDNNTIEYSTSSPYLKDGVIELVRSLGGMTTLITRKKPKYKYKGEIRYGHDNHRIYITMPPEICPFKVSYKANKYVPRTKYLPRRQIVDVVDTGRYVPMQCIKVAAKDSLYVTDDYVVTHNTMFAKGIATKIGAAITIVSGPELKTMYVGESERKLREVFLKARQSAPSIIVFDEIDSFATARGNYVGSGVEHSMVNQLLTEMDGFHKEELVFVVGTTNFVESLDPALLRPGRFEFHIRIDYPDDIARKAIVEIYNKKMKLKMSEDALAYAVRRTSNRYLTKTGTPFSGDHINAMCRSIARLRLRDRRKDETTPEDIERAMTEFDEKLDWTDKEATRLATHEAGHFVCALSCTEHQPPEQITIRSEMPWAPAYVAFKKDETFRIGYTKNQLLDNLVVLCGGIESERLLLKDISTGAGGSDLVRATSIAQNMVESLGMGEGLSSLRVYRNEKGEREVLSGNTADLLDKRVNTLLFEAQNRAAELLKDNKEYLGKLIEELKEKTVITGDRVLELIDEFTASRLLIDKYKPDNSTQKRLLTV